MTMMHIARRSFAISSGLLILALCLSLWPQSTAAIRVVDVLTDDNLSYGKGRFFRTGLAAESVGGVQLVPVKVQQSWGTAAGLPKELSSHTSAVYGNRLFVVGGKTYGPDGTVTKSGRFFSTKLANHQTGALHPWEDQPELPPLPLAVSDASSVVIEVGGQPYLFVLGGQRQVGSFLDDVTTSRIFYYPIREDANGHLIVSQWREIGGSDQLQRLPHNTFAAETNNTYRGGGASGMGAVAMTHGGIPYIYVFGGFNRVHTSAGGYTNRYHSAVYRASVSGTNDDLSLNWGGMTPATQIGGGSGVPLAGAAVVTFTHPDTNDIGVYLIGGVRCNNLCDNNPAVEDEERAYVARITPAGALTWLPLGNMSEKRSAHDAIQAEGQIIVAAGRTNDAPTVTLAQGFVGTENDDLALYRDPEFPNAPNFDLSQGMLGDAKARMNHTMETLSGGQHGDWIYIIGGRVEEQQGLISDASNQVLVGNLATPAIEDEDSFVATGKYYSEIVDYGSGARFFHLRWKAMLEAGQQVTMQYRIGNDRDNLGSFSAPVGSVDGWNQLDLPSASTYRYIQFMATLTRGGGALRASPILDTVSLDADSVRFPNVRVATQDGASITPNPISANSLVVPVVKLVNQPFVRQDGTAVRTAPANWNGEGYFYVDLFITYGGSVDQPAPPPDAPRLGQTGDVYARVNKASLPVGTEYTIPNDRFTHPGTNRALNPDTWRPAGCVSQEEIAAGCLLVDWHSLFSRSGLYYVWVMVDSLDEATASRLSPDSERRHFGNIVESAVKERDGETDNFTRITVVVNADRIAVFLPLVGGGPSTIGGAAAPQSVLGPREEPGR